MGMTSEERRKKLKELELPTAAVRKQILSIFEDLAFAKRDEQEYFLIGEIGYVINSVWDGPDKPSLADIEFYLDQAATTKSQYSKHSQFGYRYNINREH
jgi:hypothetical protein